MERGMNGEREYDFREHDRIWQRVAPGLTPYPALREGSENGMLSQELRLPGAEANPCCLGSAAAESLPVLEGFLEEEQQTLALERMLLRRATSPAAAAVLERLIRGGEGIERKLSAVSFLIDGCWGRTGQLMPQPRLRRFAEGLRTAYHLEVCGAMNYERAAEGTADVCLSRILKELSQEKYARADRVLKLIAEHCR